MRRIVGLGIRHDVVRARLSFGALRRLSLWQTGGVTMPRRLGQAYCLLPSLRINRYGMNNETSRSRANEVKRVASDECQGRLVA